MDTNETISCTIVYGFTDSTTQGFEYFTLPVFQFSSYWGVLSMPFGGVICPLMFLFVTSMTLTKPVWSQLVPCWSICDPNDRPAEVIACMSSPFSLLLHLRMLRSPVVAGYSGQGLCRPGTFTFIKTSGALTAGTCGQCLSASYSSHWLFVVSSQSIKSAHYC